MTYLATAAFDPVFWMHHCNVDRLFAMWQAVNPNSYGGSQVAPAHTWTIAKGSTQDSNSPLTPFHRNSAGDFWTTNGVRNWRSLGYNYPEFAHSGGGKRAIQKYINKLYGPNASGTAGSSKRDTTPLVANNGSLFQYVANIQTPRYALGGSYQIFLFNGKPANEDPLSFIFDPNLIGPMGVLASDTMAGNDMLAAGSIPLTRTLTDVVGGGILGSLAEDIVVPYLTQNLEWRIVGPEGDSVDPTSIPDFEITVYASTATMTAVEDLPNWTEFIPLADITEEKDGGATLKSITGSNSTASRM